MESSERTCPVRGGELRVRLTGTGPPLLVIAGGLGSADSYRPLAKHLGTEFTMISYDRRGHFGSSDRTNGAISVSQHAEDARAVIDHCGLAEALVFGTSAGAVIALELLTRFPEVVSGLVAHEPPLVRMLPEADEWLTFAKQQVAASQSGDTLRAFTYFVNSLAGAELPDLRATSLPNEHEWSFLFEREIAEFYAYLPETATLRDSARTISPVGGTGSRGYYHYRPAQLLAAELGVEFVEMPGAHLAPQRNPARFAEALRERLSVVGR